MLSSAQNWFTVKDNHEAQHRYKHQYDKSSTSKYQIDDWVFVYTNFPSEKIGDYVAKFSQPWSGPH